MDWLQSKALDYLRGELSEEEAKAFEESLATSAPLRAEIERSRELLEVLAEAKEESVVERVHGTIRAAIREGASEIHVVPGRGEIVISFRVGGAWVEKERYSREQAPLRALLNRWKLMADCNLTERRVPQRGKVGVLCDGRDFDLHLACLPTVYGERIAVRLVAGDAPSPTLETLELPERAREALPRWARSPSGMVVVAGPVGSGTGEVLHALLGGYLAGERAREAVIAIESPVERVVEGISQVEVEESLGLTVAAALRGAVQSAPEFLLVGDLPDGASAELALRAAATGGAVAAGLVARGALDVVGRLRERGADAFLIAQALAAVVATRRVRRVCPECLGEYEPSPSDLARAGLSVAEDGPFRRGAGCPACRRTGFRGEVRLFEILEMEDPLRRLIAEDAPEEALRRESFGRTGGTLWDDAREKVRAGLTTVEEVSRALFDYPATLPSRGVLRLPLGSPRAA